MVVEKKRVGGFHIFLIVIASSIFVFSLGKIILFALGGEEGLYLISTSTNIFGWLNAITGTIAAIVLFTSEIKHIKNTLWYPIFLVGIIIFILNNTITLIDSIIQIIQDEANYFNALKISQDIFAIGFWVFTAWFAKRELNEKN